MMQYYESRCPVVNIRQERLFAMIDPLNMDIMTRYEFDLEVGDLIETETSGRILANGEILKEGPTHNDFYGLGTSWDEVIEWAAAKWEKFDKFDIEVETKIKRFPITFDLRKPPFYRGSVRYFSVPVGHWRPVSGADRLASSEDAFIIWRNGAATAASETVSAIVDEFKVEDMAGERRRTY